MKVLEPLVEQFVHGGALGVILVTLLFACIAAVIMIIVVTLIRLFQMIKLCDEPTIEDDL